MAHPRIIVYRSGHERIGEILQEMNCPGEIITARTLEEFEELVPSAEIVFGWKIPPHLFRHARQLRWIQSMGAGVDDLVSNPDLPSTVMITRIVDQFGSSIAEFVFAELLAHVRRLDRLRQQQRDHLWEPLAVGTLRNQRIGIAGLGSIGQELVRKARAFDMVVYGLSREPKPEMVDKAFSSDQWILFVQSLDYLVITLPVTEKTRGVVGQQVLQAMKPEALIINVGRGEVINQQALVDALTTGQIAGAVLDVFETEPLPSDNILWDLPGVRISPHIAGPSIDEYVARYFVKNVERYINQEPLYGWVDRQRGY
ncbi:MAG: D-2-hydroxyacid dehydrogenase [Sulfobacillus thermosulfidooxidans]|uniref:D-2-hydroxyacid dehydrogenase n=1 Tax=Sulfobacillus thermosulfidooxidans TaxID=28034 RepID=A0A2T2WXA4_SULTH|nr:MAG: D-2-hydroxyacid dehydrogenase [Sulfobacillus thermosulfidooxidans]